MKYDFLWPAHHIFFSAYICLYTLQTPAKDIMQSFSKKKSYGSGHEGVAVLLPGFAIIW